MTIVDPDFVEKIDWAHEGAVMLQIAAGVRVYLACWPIDMRKGLDGLCAEVAQALRADPFSGSVFIFRSKRADHLKILTFDGSGLCLFAKRLERGKFVWPPIVDGSLKLTPAQMTLLVEGIDWRRTVAPDEIVRPRLL